MRTRTTVVVGVLALLLAVPRLAAGTGASVSRDYPESVKDTIADNNAQGPNNVSLARNVLCEIHPYDAYNSYYPAFYGSGAGTLEASAHTVLLKGTDRAAFTANCSSPSFSRGYRLDVAYRFQSYGGRGEWIDLGPGFACSAEAAEIEDMRVAHVQVPSLDCPSEQIYAEGDPSLSRPHRLQIELTTSADDGKPGPQIKGWSIPWMLNPVEESPR